MTKNILNSILVALSSVLVISCGSEGNAPTPEYSGVRRIFVSSSTSQGNFGNVEAADALCNADSLKPTYSGTFKAMVTSTTRRACSSFNCSTSGSSENLDWVLSPNTYYERIDGAAIGTTTEAAIFSFSLATSFDLLAKEVWTALSSSWMSSGSNCLSWTNNTSGSTSVVGLAHQTDSRSISSYSQFCDRAQSFICVEQPMGSN